MRIDQRMLEDAESLPDGVDLPLDKVAEPWRGICADWFDLTAAEKWDDRLLPPAAAAMYGLPMPDQMPRPGAVSSWTHREWIGWATAHGFEEVPRSKHAYQYRHRLAPWILLSMSSSPGDHRWSMATATDLRFAIGAAINRLGANLYVAVQAVSANTDRHPSAAARERLRLLRNVLVEQPDRESALRWVATNGDVRWELFDRVDPEAGLVGEIRALFATLTKEFDLSPRAALRRAGYDQDEAALLAKRLSGTTAGDVLPGDLRDELGELVDRLREERDAVERAKEAARAARPDDAVAAPEREAPPVETPDARAAQTRHELRRRLETVRAAAAQAAAAIDKCVAEALAAAEGAVLAPADELARLRVENETLRARVAELEQLRAMPAAPRKRARGARATAGDAPAIADAASGDDAPADGPRERRPPAG